MASKTTISPQAQWDLIIEPQRRWFDLRLHELWRARELIMLFVWRDFVSLYNQTILGPFWYLIQPVLTATAYAFLFGYIAKLPTDGLPFFLFYLSGTVSWSYFSSCLSKTSNTFSSNAGLFGKVYFPRLSVPISIIISNLIAFASQLVMFLCFTAYFWTAGADIRPNMTILILPLLLLIMAGLGMGIGIIISALTTRYRDLRFLVGFGTQLWMYATPVIYPLSAVPDSVRWLIQMNPMTPIVITFRYAFLGSGIWEPWGLLYSFGVMLVVLLTGIVLFNRIEANFMDTV